MTISFETLAFYRGLSSDIPLDRASLLKPRKDRNPRDTPANLHETANSWFTKKFGVPYRNALFVTPNRVIAQFYGKSPDHCVRIIPLGSYSYCWSSRYADFLHLAKDAPSSDALTYRLESAGYATTDLNMAHSSGNELMLFCEKYIAIPIGLLEFSADQMPTSNIIIL
jgi:hypothetical protein